MAALFRYAYGSLAKPIMRIVARTAFESGSIAKLKPLSSFPLNAGILGVNTTRSFSIGKQNYALVKSDFQHSGLDFEQKVRRDLFLISLLTLSTLSKSVI